MRCKFQTHPWASAAGGKEAPCPPGFSYMVFFGLFCYFSVFLLFSGLSFPLASPGRGLIVLSFGNFFAIFRSSVPLATPPSWKFFCRRPWTHLLVDDDEVQVQIQLLWWWWGPISRLVCFADDEVQSPNTPAVLMMRCNPQSHLLVDDEVCQ